ncbi:MAG: thioredoxin family protein [Bacteroidota bacterium]|nr:thioredoxin family protein [Bacteroidota bacterium]
MTNEIKILCPPHQCKKCKRIINKLKETLENADANYKLEVVNQLEELLKYPTWILPTIVINGHVVARGYAPDVKTIQKHLHTV